LRFKSLHIDLPEEKFTRLSVLQHYMRLYDPVGLIGPVAVRARRHYSKMCQLTNGWEDPVPEELRPKWATWFRELKMLDQVKLQRCVFLSDRAWLAVFSDAADGAVGAVAYLVNPETTTSRLLFSKAKINAVVSNTVPALELAGTVKATTVARSLWRAYGVPVERTYFFADAELCVNWIRNPKREVTREVARKVQKIRIKTLPEHWRHCPGVQNPADTISRGESLSRLLKSDTWWTGPQWLTEGEENWPITKGEAFGHTPVFMENVVRRVVGTYMARKTTPEPAWEPSVAWNWEKSCRRADIMYKFVQWFQSRLTGRPEEETPGTTGPRPPQYSELLRGWNILLMQSQKNGIRWSTSA
jgi:hypothetical protein